MTQLSALRVLIIESTRKIAGDIADAALTSTLFAPAVNASTDASNLTDSDAAAIVMLATIFVVLVGAMLTPAVIWAARQPLIRRAAAMAAWAGIRWAFWQVIRLLLFPLPLG
jgi:hypothetical protein